MRRRGSALALGALALLLSIPWDGTCAEETRSKLETELQDLMARMDQAIVAGDIEAAMRFYADDAVVLPNNAPRIDGKAAVRKQMEAQRKTGVTFGSFKGTVERAWVCDGMVYCVGRYALSANLPGVPRPVGDRGKSLAIFRRAENGTLQLVYDMWNTDVEYGK